VDILQVIIGHYYSANLLIPNIGFSIKQKVAQTMQSSEFILLAGDAAHTHSSAFAQGMNTGVHDATNLIWKLSGTIKGWDKKEVLDTYNEERRSAVQKVINIDQQAAAAISGDSTAVLKALGISAQDAMQSIFQENMTFTVGLGVRYSPSVLNAPTLSGTLVSGMRGPDALLYAPGPSVPLRLQDIIHRQSRGRWSFLVFAGYPHYTKREVSELRAQLSSDNAQVRRWSKICRMSTIMVGTTGCPWDAFNGPAIGNLYFDKDFQAHDRYGIYPEHGAILIIRPDGIFGFAAPLTELTKVGDYFDAMCT
jgi:phenol 2-monooxygenase (NADPH)